MAALTTTYLDTGKSWNARIKEHNAELLAKQVELSRRMRTPEFAFPKSFDNSRLVLTPDPARPRQIRLFSAAITVLFSLTMLYGLQHLSVRMSGYQIESEKHLREQLREDNRQLHLSEAQLTEPGRIDRLARELGLAEPKPGQVVRPVAPLDASAPALAQAVPQRAATSF
jgi:cell division protein FtsL